MKSKLKTIIGILLFAILVAGSYYAYNTLSSKREPGINVPGRSSSDMADNVDSGLQDNNADNNNKSTEDSTDTARNSNKPGESNGSQDTGNTGQDKPQKIKAFDFTVYTSEGEQANLSDFFGKPVIINFWATWCPYCVEEMPLFEEYYNEYKDDIHFLMVDSTDGQRETKEKGEKFIEEKGYTFPVYYDLDLDATMTYQAYSLPTSVFIDKDGYVIAYQPGMLTETLLQKGIELILD